MELVLNDDSQSREPEPYFSAGRLLIGDYKRPL